MPQIRKATSGLGREGVAHPNPSFPKGYHFLLTGTGVSGSHLFRRMLGRAQAPGFLGLCGNKFQTIPFGYPLPSRLQAHFYLFGLEIC